MSEIWNSTWLPVLIAALLLAVVFRRPALWLVKLSARSLVWLGGLFLLGAAGLGVLGVNCFNALVLGLLGLPGAGLLLSLVWLK